MNIVKIPIIFTLFALVLISGCIETSDVDVVLTNEKGVVDVLVIKDIDTLPESEVMPNSNIKMLFTIANMDENEREMARDVVVELYNPFIFKDAETNIPCIDSDAVCLPNDCYNISGATCTELSLTEEDCNQECNIRSLEEKFINIDLRSPTRDEIANIITERELDFKVTYTYTTNYNYPVLVVSENEILRLQGAGESITKKLNAAGSSGPVQIYGDLIGKKDYILDGFDSSIKFTIKDEGNGQLVDYQVKAQGFEILFPSRLLFDPTDVTNIEEPSDFTCEPEGQNIRCYNINPIDLYQGETRPMFFDIKQVSGSGGSMVDYLVRASLVDYSYEIRDSVDIAIVPQ